MYAIKRFFASVYDWLFPKKELAIQTADYMPIEDAKPKRKKREAFYTAPDGVKQTFPQSFSELLDNLKTMFNRLQLPTAHSWLTADERIGLTRLGIYLPHPWYADNPAVVKNPHVRLKNVMPAFMCAAFPVPESPGFVSPHLMYAIKATRLPLGVEPKPGVPYKVGVAFVLDHKTLWTYTWATVNQTTGAIDFCKEQRYKQQVIKKERVYYMQKFTDFSCIFDEDPEVKRTKAESLHIYRVLFAQLFNWWTDRKDRSWNVSVKKGKQRITFSINKAETKSYFADRNKTVKTSTGKAKKIVHYVAGHTRVVNGKEVWIKEHLRGESKFTWNGYECVVNAPKFSQMSSVDFDVAGEDDVPPEQAKGMLGMTKVAEIIAAHEEGREIKF